jgi:hypothetical protein
MQPTLKIKELNLNIALVTKRLKEQRKMKSIYTRRGDLSIAANIGAHIKQSEEQLNRYTAEYTATLNA